MGKLVSKKSNTLPMKFGTHLIFDAYNCSPQKLNNMEWCYNLLLKLTEIVKTNKIGEPVIHKANENETLGGKDPGGFSGFLILQESHISIHTFPKRGFATLDLYSCKKFGSDEVIKFLKEGLETEDVDVMKIDRGLRYPKDNIF